MKQFTSYVAFLVWLALPILHAGCKDPSGGLADDPNMPVNYSMDFILASARQYVNRAYCEIYDPFGVETAYANWEIWTKRGGAIEFPYLMEPCIGFRDSVMCSMKVDTSRYCIWNERLDERTGFNYYDPQLGSIFHVNSLESLLVYLKRRNVASLPARCRAFVLSTAQYNAGVIETDGYEATISGQDMVLGLTYHYRSEEHVIFPCLYNDSYPAAVVFEFTVKLLENKVMDRMKEKGWYDGLDWDEFGGLMLWYHAFAHEAGHAFGLHAHHADELYAEPCALIGVWPSFNEVNSFYEGQNILRRYLYSHCICEHCSRSFCKTDYYRN